jgi:hypothetical protein
VDRTFDTIRDLVVFSVGAEACRGRHVVVLGGAQRLRQ